MNATSKVYRAKNGRYGREKAQLIGERLAALGTVTPSSVVDDARDPSSPLHDCFTWDDGIAAEKWRREEARLVVQSIIVDATAKNGETIEVRAFYHVVESTEADEGEEGEEETRTLRYVEIDEVQANEDFRAQVVATAKSELAGWRERWKAYGDVFGVVFRSIDDMEKGAAV